MLRMENLWLW